MTSEALKQKTAPLPQGKWTAYRQEGNGFRILREETVRNMTIKELINGPHVLRIDLPTQGRVYFVGSDEPYLKLNQEGKTVQWLHNLFEGFRLYLISKGLSPHTSIYEWSVGHLWSTQAALEIFEGSKEVCRCEQCEPGYGEKKRLQREKLGEATVAVRE